MEEIVFDQSGDFQAFYAAQHWCKANGISYGSSCGYEPIGLMYGDCRIAKWKNLTAKERKTVDGIMTGDLRRGPIKIKMYVVPIPEPRDNK